MNKLILAFFCCTLANGVASDSTRSVQDLAPDPSLWITTGPINMEVICYTNPEAVNVTESAVGAVVRVYLRNQGDHTLFFVATSQDYGFSLQGEGTHGSRVHLRTPEHVVSIIRVLISPGTQKSFTISLNKADLPFLQNKSLIVAGRIYDPAIKEMIRIQAPVNME